MCENEDKQKSKKKESSKFTRSISFHNLLIDSFLRAIHSAADLLILKSIFGPFLKYKQVFF